MRLSKSHEDVRSSLSVGRDHESFSDYALTLLRNAADNLPSIPSIRSEAAMLATSAILILTPALASCVRVAPLSDPNVQVTPLTEAINLYQSKIAKYKHEIGSINKSISSNRGIAEENNRNLDNLYPLLLSNGKDNFYNAVTALEVNFSDLKSIYDKSSGTFIGREDLPPSVQALMDQYNIVSPKLLLKAILLIKEKEAADAVVKKGEHLVKVYGEAIKSYTEALQTLQQDSWGTEMDPEIATKLQNEIEKALAEYQAALDLKQNPGRSTAMPKNSPEVANSDSNIQ